MRKINVARVQLHKSIEEFRGFMDARIQEGVAMFIWDNGANVIIPLSQIYMIRNSVIEVDDEDS